MGNLAATIQIKAREFAKKTATRVPLKERIIFIKQLAVLMRAGLSLFSSLRMLEAQSRSKAMKFIMRQVVADIENGQYLATALGKFKYIFGELAINIIAVGEISGNLAVNLDHLAATLKKKQALRRRVIGASVYPVFIVIATLVITVMLTIFVFPKIVPVFQSINYQLPWSTRLLIYINGLAKNKGAVIGLGISIFMIGTWLLLMAEKIRMVVIGGLMYVPFVNKIVATYNSTSICRTLGLLLDSGVPVVRAFHIASNTTANLVYKKELQIISDKITQGEIISASISKNQKLFPVSMGQMIAVGESTGKLSETFSYLAEMYEEEMDEMTKSISTTIEPLLLIFMGILVGFIAISIISPIYGITQYITPK